MKLTRSNNIMPFDMQAEIIKNLPVKSLMRFQSVSKAWKSHIHTSDFIARYSNHSNHHIQVPKILVRYIASIGIKREYVSMVNDDTLPDYKYVSIVDDDTFPRLKSSLHVPLLVRFLKRSSIIGSSHGLLCLYGDYEYSHDGSISGKARVVLWNLLLGNVVAVVVRNVAFTRHYSANAESYMNEEMYGSVLGFGVCRQTTDPKIVKINYINTNWPREMKSTIPWQVEVFTLSTGAWRRPRCVNLPRRSISFVQFGVGVDVGGVIYWLARDRIIFNGRFRYSYHLIVSFDLTTEKFREINLPDSLARSGGYNLSICKHRESLIVLERHNEAVWMLKDGVPEPLTKVFTIGNTPHISIIYVYVRGFRKTGEPIIEIEEDHSQRSGERPLGVYERNSKHVNNIGIIGMCNSFSVYSFVGTLLLLDQPNVKIYDKRLVRI